MKNYQIIKFLTIVLLVAYTGLGADAQNRPLKKTTGKAGYQNPVFAGDYPDPSILRDGSDYYMVHSSFMYYPGLLIWHSKDLINWVPVTHALHKNVGSVWAPDLVKYKNKFYIYFPANNTNYVVTANNISGPWSEPVDLKVSNIDPGHVTDSVGNRYLYFSNGGYCPLSEDGTNITGPAIQSYNGWPIPNSWSIECFCMEGPKIVKRGDYYYLTVAEGGTAGPATSHMIISARSKSPLGPWENSPYNPIERTRSSSERWWSKGHGTLFEDVKGNWWMLFHAYENGYYNMGRQTLLEPVEWTADGWFRIKPDVKTDAVISYPFTADASASVTLDDSFTGKQLNPLWKFYGGADTSRWKLTGNGSVVDAKGNSVGESYPLTTVPSAHSYTVEVEMTIEGNATGGLVLFYSNSYHSGILADSTSILADLRAWQFTTVKNVIKRHVFLHLKNSNHAVDMFYSTDGNTWTKIENSAEVSGLHHNVLGGFSGLRIALVAQGSGTVIFKNFRYKATGI